jgi:adenine-specific DNA methylase
MKRQEYLDLQKKHRKEFEDFPIAYAFNDKQLKEALEKLGATKEECVSVFGHGDIIKRENAKALIEMMRRHDAEMKQKLKEDHEFAEAAFLYEMDNHEYAINWSADEDVLGCFNITFNDIRKWGLHHAYDRARQRHMKNAEDWGVI